MYKSPQDPHMNIVVFRTVLVVTPKGLFGAHVAPRSTCQIKFSAPTARHGATLLFGARCAMGLGQKLHGASLVKWRTDKSSFPCSSLCAEVTVTTDCN